ncbi:MAG TPA: hypothetical protein VK131_08420, partial [Candidatus Acidoferrales bacterium]|nr:hypothetical protein [Candidatus Acidoferrales bacterium]
MTEAPWRRRFRAPQVSLPGWARANPGRLLYGSNSPGKWELFAWDLASGRHRQVTDRPEGTGRGRLTPLGHWIWWFDDDRGSEFGRWRHQKFSGGPSQPAAALPEAYPNGLALGSRGLAVVGLSDDSGSSLHVLRLGRPAQLLYHHREDASVEGLSRDERLVSIEHSEHGDSRHPAVRVMDLAGRAVADLWDGPGHGLEAGPWSPRPGDQRLILLHERAGLQRPAIWSPVRGELRELEIDLPGEVGATWYPDARALLLAHDHQARTQLYRLDLETARLERLDHPPGTIEAAQVRPDGEVWYHWSSAAQPPQVRADGRLLLRPPGEAAPAGVPFQDLWVNGVHAFLAEPFAPRPHPTVFGVHGGPA